MGRPPSQLTPEEISRHFFSKQEPRREAAIENAPASLMQLTASARYVTREAKKRLAQQSAVGGETPKDEGELFRLIRLVEEAEGEELSDIERTAVAASLSASFDHYDILTPLVDNPDVNDIIVRAYDDISVQTHRRNIQTDLKFADYDSYRSFVENLLKRAGKSCTVATPVVDAAIDPTIRACVTHESFSPAGTGPMLTLRVARHRYISLESLVHFQLAPSNVLEYLAAIVASGTGTLLVAGEVGTGKTTLVKALALRIPEDEAILIIEDTHELLLQRRFVRTLLTREANTEGAGRISPAMAIRTGMRMAMNRLLLGEMRDGEAAEAFIDVCASGHSGISTIHARSAKDALSRLELFLARAQGNVMIDAIRRQIANAVSVVVYMGMDKFTGHRHILEVLEVESSSDGAIQVSPIFRYRPRQNTPEWVREAGVSRFSDVLREQGVRLTENGSILRFEQGI